MANNTTDKTRRSGSHPVAAAPGFLKPATPRLSRSVQAQLGERLRHFYETLKLGEQPIPDRFVEIINRLDRAPGENRS